MKASSPLISTCPASTLKAWKALIATASFLPLVMVGTAQAATDTWTGATSTNFGDANWSYSSGSGPVTSGDSLVFNAAGSVGSPPTTLNENLTAGITFNALTFGMGASAYTIAGNAFNLGTSTAATSLTNSSTTALETINDNITLGNAAQTVSIAAGGITLGGIVSGAGSSSGITTTGMGTLTLTGAGSSIGTLTSQGNVVIDTGGSLTATSTTVGTGSVSGVLTVQNTGSLTTAGLNLGTDGGTENSMVNLSGSGSLTSTGGVNLGVYYRTGTAIINQSGSSTFNASGQTVSLNALGITTYNLSGGTYSAGTTILGQYGNTAGVFNQSGGTATMGTFNLGFGGGSGNASAGDYNLSGTGILNVNSTFHDGNGSLGIVQQTGGTVNVSSAGSLILAYSGNAIGIYTITAGALNSSSAILVGNGTDSGAVANLNVTGTGAISLDSNQSVYIGSAGSGGAGSYAVNQNGGTVTFYSDAGVTPGGSGGLHFGEFSNGGGTDTYNLNGGTLETNYVTQQTATGTTGTFNFNGGTIEAITANTTFMQGLTSANIYGGGATVNTNGVNITIGQALLGTTGHGVDSVTVTAGGSNYVVAPR